MNNQMNNQMPPAIAIPPPALFRSVSSIPPPALVRSVSSIPPPALFRSASSNIPPPGILRRCDKHVTTEPIVTTRDPTENPDLPEKLTPTENLTN